ncbi:hypothetical protein [Nodularia sp. NIES-3585]|uniref:hypothetical protein n=1 Tax=Nodularia sp. NIES-3585 TaxID=1973477 RepID=UPI000B72191B|nr:hypothetical protein [Nodularia sp. NIES-3585]GAX34130.1 hypothetical protein NIES3585_01290 [Nodularia sp. NIES-3585]
MQPIDGRIMLNLFIISLAILFYLVLAYCFCKEWLYFLQADKDMTPEQQVLSYVILVIAIIFWPLVVPFAYLELLKSYKKYKSTVELLTNIPDSHVLDK